MSIEFNDTTLFMDIESHSVHERWDMEPKEFFRLGQWAWGEGEVHTTTDYHEFMGLLDRASMIVAHNGHAFDWSVLYGKDSIVPVHLARKVKLFDTLTHAMIAYPAPFGSYVNSAGTRMKCTKPGDFRKWYKLENLGYQLGVDGKLFDLADLADKYSHTLEQVYTPTGKIAMTKGEPRMRKVPIPGLCCGYGAIPVDDPDFDAYARQDIVALRNVARALLEKMPFDAYAKRAQMIMALMAQVTRNGFKVNQDLMNERIKNLAEEAAWILDDLNDRYGLPLEKKKPLSTNEGKEALTQAFAELGIGPEKFGTTDSGAVSWSGDSVMKASGHLETDHGWKRPENPTQDQIKALELGEAVATLAGQRSLAELTRDSLYSDGYVHPDIAPLQRSGRMSTTNPGLTIWDDSHKDYYEPDSREDLLASFDFSNADARAVAAESGDTEFAVRFQPGQDGHTINAIAAWGKEVVDSDPKFYRQRAKAPGHGWGYKIGAKKLAATTGLPVSEAKMFLENLNAAFKGVVAWQARVTRFASRHGFVLNDWGRKMPVERGREFTQAPALKGQGDTNELLMDGCMRLPDRLLRRLKLTVHDEIILSLSKETLDTDIETVIRCFSTRWKPRDGGQEIEFPMTLHGAPGRNWQEAAKEH